MLRITGTTNRIVDLAAAGSAVNPIQRAMLRLAGTDRYLSLRRSTDADSGAEVRQLN